MNLPLKKHNAMKKLLILALATIAVGCGATRKVVSEADAAAAHHIDQMLAQRLYKVDFTRAYPASAPSFALNWPYFISVIEGRVESFLPYFGRAYSLPYGGGEGLRFDAPITSYAERMGRRGQREITFTARTGEDSYEFLLTVWPLGESTLSVMPRNRQSISFGGQIDPEPKFEAVRKTGK